MDRHPNARDFVWVQEEPANMGALPFVEPRIEHLAHGRSVLTVNAPPAPPLQQVPTAPTKWNNTRSLALAFGTPEKP